MPTIAAIESAGPDGRARRIRFDDGTERTTSASVVKALKLESATSARSLEERLAALEPELARERALRLLGYRERSTAELSGRLINDGYPDGVVAEIVDVYHRVGLLDDARFAEAYVRTKRAEGYGASRILNGLRKKGICPETASDAIAEPEGDGEEVRRARACLRGAVPADRKERERLLRRLISRGFSMRIALQALDSPDTSPTTD